MCHMIRHMTNDDLAHVSLSYRACEDMATSQETLWQPNDGFFPQSKLSSLILRGFLVDGGSSCLGLPVDAAMPEARQQPSRLAAASCITFAFLFAPNKMEADRWVESETLQSDCWQGGCTGLGH